MEDIHSGATGVDVPNHAEEKFRNVLVHVPIPSHKMEGETVVGWDEIQNQGGVTETGAQVNSLFTIWAKNSFDLLIHFSKLMVAFILFSFLANKFVIYDLNHVL